jgi:hypothetical protein
MWHVTITKRGQKGQTKENKWKERKCERLKGFYKHLFFCWGFFGGQRREY